MMYSIVLGGPILPTFVIFKFLNQTGVRFKSKSDFMTTVLPLYLSTPLGRVRRVTALCRVLDSDDSASVSTNESSALAGGDQSQAGDHSSGSVRVRVTLVLSADQAKQKVSHSGSISRYFHSE